jgi:hypothetical protein
MLRRVLGSCAQEVGEDGVGGGEPRVAVGASSEARVLLTDIIFSNKFFPEETKNILGKLN